MKAPKQRGTRTSDMRIANQLGFAAPRLRRHRETKGRKLDFAACAVKVKP